VRCWHCKTELIWGGTREINEKESDYYCQLTNLSCPKCDCHVDVYLPNKEKKKDET